MTESANKFHLLQPSLVCVHAHKQMKERERGGVGGDRLTETEGVALTTAPFRESRK